MTQDRDAVTTFVASQMRRYRKARDWSAQRLADEMTAVGVGWDRMIVTNLEHGRRQIVTCAELLALAYVLDVAPMTLLVPVEDSRMQVTPKVDMASTTALAWICGEIPPFEPDRRRAWLQTIGPISTARDFRAAFNATANAELRDDAAFASELGYLAQIVNAMVENGQHVPALPAKWVERMRSMLRHPDEITVQRDGGDDGAR